VPRTLRLSEVSRLTSRKGVRGDLVKSFLDGCVSIETEQDALVELEEVASARKWNRATQRAIKDGLHLIYGGI
jgi:hypothetical protein